MSNVSPFPSREQREWKALVGRHKDALLKAGFPENAVSYAFERFRPLYDQLSLDFKDGSSEIERVGGLERLGKRHLRLFHQLVRAALYAFAEVYEAQAEG